MRLQHTRAPNIFASDKLKPVILSGLFLPSTVLTLPAMAQDSAQDDNNLNNGLIEEVVVEGIRKTVRNSIDIKRDATTIVDGLSVDDIGDLPALSIGEAIETITGAASHREQGGATEISIRGLGPFLGSTVINNREATNGTGDRSVNFSQFPSELFNAIKVYKTQEASLIEGGVSAQIALETVKPLDFGKQRIQAELKGNWNPDNSDIDDNERDFGSRTTFSYIDQFEFENLGALGISLGVQSNVTTNPEQEARSTSTFRDCRFDPNTPEDGVFASGNCDSGNGGLDLEVDPETGVAPDAGVPFAIVPSSRSFRQNITDDERESFFAALQWQPNSRLDINADFQYSDREFTEIRNDLVFAENRRIDAPNVSLDERLPTDLVILDNGTVTQFTNEQRIETNSQFQERLEEYKGGGITFDFDVNDALSVSFDVSYSDTTRRENIIQTRLQSEPVDIFGNPVPGAADGGRIETATVIGQIPTFTVQNFDVNNHDLFADAARTRVDLNQFRNNTIRAARGDFTYHLDNSEFFTSVQGGIRVSELEFDSVPRSRDEFSFEDDAIQAASLACRNDSFPESGFFSSLNGVGTLITNVDENGNIIEQGTGNTFATFDPLCLAHEFLGENPTIPGPEANIANVDVEEKTTAFYLQANYDTTFAGYPIRGNFGVRVIETEVDSVGLRGALTATFDGDGNLSEIEADDDELISVSGGSDYTEILPSFNLVVDVHDDVVVRGGIFKALSRPDPSDLGFGRSFSGLSGDSDGATSINDAVALAVANGNPNLDPFTSWNVDVAVEWYPNNDTILAIGGYYKRFKGGLENAAQVEQFNIDGETLETIVTTQQVSDENTTITGLELTASHAFSYLPGFWSGFGTKLSYNYADSDFEFEDGQFGESTEVTGNQEIERIGIVNPANLFGFSQHVFSGQFYYQTGGFNASLNYKYRSEYFQQFISTPGNLRFIGDTGVWEARMSYRVNDHVKLSLEAINIFDEPRKQFNPTTNNVSEVNIYGPRIFAGVQVRF
ncbi:TonB-dependent receptor [Sessilibacter corallicola]|uniref:TonB-dependent receptor n=1 Tax=Sessilibacter corallicola TaxID=2904075 RepID=UPI001E6471FC|nr:TonB-dependent receptor [Sessilibacter corallicola]MCE2027503.1 TonB-dependent receptor [Sessilibacter corallicola]